MPAQERADQRERDHVLERLGVGLQKRRAVARRGVGDERVEAAELVRELIDHGLRSGNVREVGLAVRDAHAMACTTDRPPIPQPEHQCGSLNQQATDDGSSRGGGALRWGDTANGRGGARSGAADPPRRVASTLC